jgi:hypothetical protein
MASLFAPGTVVTARAILLGERVDLEGLEITQRLAANPLLTSALEGQYAAHGRARRVEWYIVVLIVIEIVLTLDQLFFLGTH